jgi:hypothetical protein
MVLLFVLFCSGLNFPVIGKQGSFEGSVQKDFGIGVPASLRVVNAARQAYRDPAYFYECDVAPVDGAAFLAAIERAAGLRKYDARPEIVGNYRLMGPSPPAWFKPESSPDCVKLGVSLPGSGTDEAASGYWFYFSPSRGKLFVWWYST